MSYAEVEAGARFPQDAGAALESPIPPGTSPKNCNTIPYTPSIEVAPGTDETNSPAGAQVTVAVPHITAADRPGRLDDQGSDGDAAGGDGDQPLGGGRAEQPRRPVKTASSPLHSTAADHLPGRTRGSAPRRSRSAALPEGDLEGTGLHRQAAKHRPGLRQRVPDLHRRRTRPATGSTCGSSATSSPTRPPGS